MSSKRISPAVIAPCAEPPGPLATAWTSKLYPRFTLTAAEIAAIITRFVGTPESPGPLTTEEARYEIREAELWLCAHPTLAARRRAWARFLNRWLNVAAEKKVYSQRRQPARGSQGRHYTGGGNSDERRRALGLD